VHSRVSEKEGKEIWKNFQNYSKYDDLRDLYQRCVPPISKFEDKIKAVRDDVAKFHQIIINFDSMICEKVNRETFKEYREEANELFLHKQEIERFMSDMREEQEQGRQRQNELEEIIKNQTKHFTRELNSNIRKAIGQLKQEQEEKGTSVGAVGGGVDLTEIKAQMS